MRRRPTTWCVRCAPAFSPRRCGRFEFRTRVRTGGCAIGALRMHLKALDASAPRSRLTPATFTPVPGRSPAGGRIVLSSRSVGATEIGTDGAELARGETEIRNAARDPRGLRDLAPVSVAMGARIEWRGTHRILVQGVDALR